MKRSAETRRVAHVFALIFLAGTAPASMPAQTLTTFPLADQADAIVVGEVQSGRQTGNSLAFTLTVARTIKGTPTPGSALSVFGSSAVGENKGLTGAYGMFFLSKAGAGQWVLQPVGRGAGMGFESSFFQIPTISSPSGFTTSTVASSVNDLIAVELAAGLQAYTGPSQNYSLYQMLASLIAVPDTPVVESLFQTLRTSSKLEPRFLALARAMKQGDTSALAEVAADLALLPQLTARAFVSVGIIAQGYSGSSAPVGPLGVIAQSSDVSLQRSAANALTSIHTQDTLPFLARLLDSGDAATRELAIKGLSCFVDSLPSITHYNVINGKSIQRQGPTPYRTAQTDQYSLSTRRLVDASEPESAFLQFWKGWWAKMKPQLSAPGQQN